jgi:hypothetical protein
MSYIIEAYALSKHLILELEECVRCRKLITDDEWVTNWTLCDDCFNEDFEKYLHHCHLVQQLKEEPYE